MTLKTTVLCDDCGKEIGNELRSHFSVEGYTADGQEFWRSKDYHSKCGKTILEMVMAK